MEVPLQSTENRTTRDIRLIEHIRTVDCYLEAAKSCP